MQVEVTDADREAARVLLLNYPSQIATECAFARHRIAERERVVGEIVAMLKDDISGPMFANYFATMVKDKFGGRDV